MKPVLSLPVARQASAPIRTVVQIVLLGAVWLAASHLVDAFSLSVSAGVLGLLFVLALLLLRVVRVGAFKGGADWLLNELILFFIPSVVAVVKYFQLFRQEGVQLVFAIAVGTLLVMVSTAFSVHAGVKLEAWLRQRYRAAGACDSSTPVS